MVLEGIAMRMTMAVEMITQMMRRQRDDYADSVIDKEVFINRIYYV
jgi:hypothetical protein